MIFLTVGTQLPFDRLVRLVDEWAEMNPHVEIYAQIGEGNYVPKNMEYCSFLDEKTYAEAFDRASVIVAHAAMGSIITSLIASKPVVVFPRKASLGEHRNEHQLATCRNFEKLDGCYVCYDRNQLIPRLDDISQLKGGALDSFAPPELIENLDRFIMANA